MRCNQCDYPLWNLRDRRCPECGTDFLPSDRSYVPNSVRFCCTECGQDYYGTDSKGHLVPMAFDCLKCGKPQTMDEMVMLPTDGVSEEQTKVFVMPWLDASYTGKPLRAWYATMGLTVSGPARLCKAIPQGASVARAWWFAILTMVVLMACGLGPITLFQLAMASRFGFAATLESAGRSVVFYVSIFVGVVLVIAIWGLWAHGILKVTGPTKGTIGRTYQALLYSMACTFLLGIPLMNWLLIPVAVIWWVVASAVMLCTLQGVHGFRAFIASALLPVLLAGGVAAVIAISVATTMSAFTAMGGTPWMQNSPMVTQSITTALEDYRIERAVDGPAHAVGLVADQYLTSGDELLVMSTNTNWMLTIPGSTGSGTTYLTSFDPSMGMTRKEMQDVTKAAAETLPPNTIAHRLGDFVYTYHGIAPTEQDGTLWLVIFYPDPSSNPTPGVGEQLHMGLVDGSMITIDAGAWTVSLANQNAARSAAGLPPLPDPSTITTQSPATKQGP